MILRIWNGYTTHDNAAAYEALLKHEVFHEIQGKNIHGFKGIQLGISVKENEVAFVTLMKFTDLDAVRQFAGEDYETAYVPQAARNILSRFDAKAQHYEMVHELLPG